MRGLPAAKTWDHVTGVDPGACNKISSNYK
jgi:hypothetical protein